MNFAVHQVKIKESEKLNKYLDLNGKLKKMSNMKVTVIWMDCKSLEKRLKKLEIIGRI